VEDPHFLRQLVRIMEKTSCATPAGLTTIAGYQSINSAQLARTRASALVTVNDWSAHVPPQIMLGSWRWPLQWKSLHCHCNDFRFYVTLFQKWFKLSLTLLVRYRSSYSVFNFGRHKPADWYCIPKQYYSLDGQEMRMLGFMAQWADTFFGSILTRRVGFSNGFALYLNFAIPAPITPGCSCHNSTAFKLRFGNEFGSSSVAPDWGNHGCFLFLRWIICLSLAGSPTILRSVTKESRRQLSEKS